MPAFSSVTSLVGALRVNYAFPAAAQEDLGGRVAALISQVALLQANVLLVQSALVSASLSGVTFSLVSTAGYFATMGTISNFSST